LSRSVRKTLRECQGDICTCLLERIKQLAFAPTKEAGGGTQGLQQRFAQQVAKGAQGPGTPSWAGHETAIIEQQENLRNHLNEYRSQGCGGGPGNMMRKVNHLATRPLPTKAEWDANNPPVVPFETDDSGLSAGEVAAGVAVSVGALYIGWRVIRMLPSLAPPLWWTIPANVAIP